MTELSTELATSASILDAQPAPVRDAFNCCLCLLMVKADRIYLSETILDENGKSPLTAPAFQELHWITAPVISTYALVIGTSRP
jgi:hypothetical protein